MQSTSYLALKTFNSIPLLTINIHHEISSRMVPNHNQLHQKQQGIHNTTLLTMMEIQSQIHPSLDFVSHTDVTAIQRCVKPQPTLCHAETLVTSEECQLTNAILLEVILTTKHLFVHTAKAVFHCRRFARADGANLFQLLL